MRNVRRVVISPSIVRSLGWGAGTRLNLYVNGRVVAVQAGEPGSTILRRTSQENPEMYFSHLRLVQHIIEMYDVTNTSIKLPAWVQVDILFFGEEVEQP